MNIWVIFEYTIMATIVGTFIWVVKLIFHDKLDARWHYFIWLVLLVRLLAPVHFRMIRTPLSLFGEIPVEKWMEICALTAQKKGYGDLAVLLGRIYLWGVAGLGGWYALTWLILRVQIARAPRADADTVKYVEDIAVKYGMKRCRDIRICKSSTPYVCGVLRPVLVLPEDNPRPEEPVIVHELLHGKCRDVWVNIVIHIVCVVNWFNPVIWMLSAVVQNDSEALCDQRVLERCGEDRRQDYGKMLVDMSAGKKQNPIKIGTSNMASTYRNMRTRIRRIGDFRKVPEKIGFVTLCITLMLALAGIGSSAEEYSLEIPEIRSQEDLEKAMIHAQCYHARTPEEAVYLFLRACEERNLLYRMAVMPESEIPRYEEFVRKCFEGGEAAVRTDLRETIAGADFGENPVWPNLDEGMEEAYSAYLPEMSGMVRQYVIYNLQCDEETGSAAVCVNLRGESGSDASAEWKLELKKEKGWKVRLAEEGQCLTGEYQPEALLYGSGRLGDFLVEVSCWNEGYFERLGAGNQYPGLSWLREPPSEDGFPTTFSMEYKCRAVYITYLGEESLEGHTAKVFVADSEGNFDFDEVKSGTLEELYDAGAAAAGAPGRGTDSISESAGGSSDGSGYAVFDGGAWMNKTPRLIVSGGTGSSESGRGWKGDESVQVRVQIYIDDVLAEEGEVWSEGH